METSPITTDPPLPPPTSLHPPTSIPKVPQFPPHNAPRVWFLTDGLAPIAISLSRYLLQHGDYIVAGILPAEFNGPRGDELRGFMVEVAKEGASGAYNNHGTEDDMDVDSEEELEDREDGGDNGKKDGKGATRRKRKRWQDMFRVVSLDGRSVGQCQSACAEALAAFDRIDVLLICKSETLIGSIEELSQSVRTQSLVRDQFETNFFAPVNIIRAMLPSMREKRNGHIIALTGITAHLGTPGLGMYCSAQWALEGYCDSLAYEIAPFNIKMTIVQPNLEINVLTNKITSVPQLPDYAPDINPAPLSREILSGLLDRLDGKDPEHDNELNQTPTTAELISPVSTSAEGIEATPPTSNPPFFEDPNNDHFTSGDLLHASNISSLYPTLQPGLRSSLIQETVFAIAAIGGHDNPPARHIVGFEGVASVKEKLKTVSEELEDFLEVSGAVDIGCEDSAPRDGMDQ